MRLDPRLGKRVDPSDVVQEVYLDASRRLPEFVAEEAPMPRRWRIWLLAHQRTVYLYRQHLGVTARDVSKEVPLDARATSASSIWISQQLLDQRESPSNAAIRGEVREQLQSASTRWSHRRGNPGDASFRDAHESAALRAAGDHEGGREQPLYAGPEAAEGDLVLLEE